MKTIRFDRGRPVLLLALAGMAGLVSGAVGAGAAWADDGASLSASLTGTFQAASDSRAKSEGVLRPEIFVALPVPGIGGTLHAHVEANTTPRKDGVSAFIGEANANAGTALNSRDHGRLQISEFYYEFGDEALSAAIGLIDVKAFLDTSAIANNERSQFLSATLVNNATIEFPDYTLGAAAVAGGEGMRPSLTIVAASSHGLGDNAKRAYPELFRMGNSGKGVFAAAELGWSVPALGQDGALRAGAWTNTADHSSLNGASTTERNAGLYGVADGRIAETGWNLRAGLADQDVSAAAWFVGGALEHPFGPVTAGLGLTHTGVSDKAGAGTGNMTQAELYVKYDFSEQVHLTPSLEWVRNPGFDSTASIVDRSAWIVGLRIGLDA